MPAATIALWFRKFNALTKTNMKNLSIIALLLTLATGASGQAVTTTTNDTIGVGIPDNDLSGLASTKTFVSPITSLTDLNVYINISGTYNGDLYAYLTYGSGFSVLLNRPGRTSLNTLGYGDDGLDITLDDAAATDIHAYGGNGGNLLTGTFQPDARNTSPLTVLANTGRTDFLSSFNGLDPNGDWTLFVADVSGGDTHTLVSWGLEATGPIPEPGTTTLLALGGLGLLLAAWRRKQS